MPFQMPEIRQSNALGMINDIRQQRTQNALADRQLALTEGAQRRQEAEFQAQQQSAAQERQRAALADVFNAVESGKTPERAREIGASIMQSPEWQARFGQGGDVLAQQMLSQPDAWRPENIRTAAARFGIRLRSQELQDIATEARLKRAPQRPDRRLIRDQNQNYISLDMDTLEGTETGITGPTPPPPQGAAPANVTVLSGVTGPNGEVMILDPKTNTVGVAGQGRPAPGTPPPPLKPAGMARNATALRNEYLRETKDYRDRLGALRQVEALAGGGAVNDRVLVIAVMKVNDPTSVVREGEQAMMSNAGGVPEWLRNTYNKVLTGESLTPEQRAAMVESTRSLVNSQRPSYDATTAEYRRLAIEGGLNPSQVIVDTSNARPRPDTTRPRAAGTQRDPVRVTTPAEARALPAGTFFVGPDGTLRRR